MRTEQQRTAGNTYITHSELGIVMAAGEQIHTDHIIRQGRVVGHADSELLTKLSTCLLSDLTERGLRQYSCIVTYVLVHTWSHVTFNICCIYPSPLVDKVASLLDQGWLVSISPVHMPISSFMNPG